jgi:hypothetical protein
MNKVSTVKAPRQIQVRFPRGRVANDYLSSPNAVTYIFVAPAGEQIDDERADEARADDTNAAQKDGAVQVFGDKQRSRHGRRDFNQ